MSACMSGTRGSGVLSSTGDVFVRGICGVCDMCMCLARGGCEWRGGEWMTELSLGFTNHVGTGGVLDMCLCFGCGGVGGAGGEWVGGLDEGRERVVYSLCRWQVKVSIYCAWQITAHLRCTQCSSCCTLWISAF